MSPSYKELLGIDREAIEFEWHLFPRFSSLQILQEIQNHLRKRSMEPEKFTDRIISSRQFWTTSIGQEKEMMEFEYQLRKSQGIPRKDIGRSSVLEMKRSGMELFHTHMKENGTPQAPKWWSDSKILVIQYLRASVLWVVESWKRKITETPYISTRMLQTQSSHSDSSILQISSVFTEQFRIGVNNLVWEEESESERPLARKESVTKGVLSSMNALEAKLFYVLQDFHLETVCRNTFRTSNPCLRQFDLQYANTQSLRIEFDLVLATKPGLTGTTVLGNWLHCVENTRFLQ